MTNNYLPTDYQSFIHTSRYARWLDDKGRRESWGETVNRYIENVVCPKLYDGQDDTKDIINQLEQAILDLSVMPSMRAMMTAGPDRKSTRLNSSHGYISYAVFCLKKKKKYNTQIHDLT